MEKNTFGEHKVQRRTILRGAAWSAPVIAAAVAAPLAAASITNPETKLSVNGAANATLDGANNVGGVLSGSFAGGYSVTNAGTAWDISRVTLTYSISQVGLGGYLSDATITLPDGSSIPAEGQYLTYDGIDWLVVTNDGATNIQLQAAQAIPVPANGTTSGTAIPLKYSVTLAKTVPQKRINFTLNVEVETSEGKTLNGIGGISFA